MEFRGTERRERSFRVAAVGCHRAVGETLPNLDKLQPIDRASRYREYAEEMFCHARYASSDEIRLGYLRMAVDWLNMADKVEAEYCKTSVTFDAPELASMLRQVRPASS
jgi:hypothetical protein